MNRLFVSLLATTLLVSCNSSKKATASRVGTVPLYNYYVKNDVALPDEYNHRVLVDASSFDAFAGTAATMTNQVQRPDFNGQVVVAVAARPSRTWQDLRITGATIGGREMNVYYTASKGETKTFNTTAVALATVPKAKSVNTVNFYRDSVLTGTATVKIP